MPTPFNPGILTKIVKDKRALHAAYMPFVKPCGLFITTNKPYQLGDEVFILLSLLQEPARIPLSGKVVWLTPNGADGNRQPGIGVRLTSKNAAELHRKINLYLAGSGRLNQFTYTM